MLKESPDGDSTSTLCNIETSFSFPDLKKLKTFSLRCILFNYSTFYCWIGIPFNFSHMFFFTEKKEYVSDQNIDVLTNLKCVSSNNLLDQTIIQNEALNKVMVRISIEYELPSGFDIQNFSIFCLEWKSNRSMAPSFNPCKPRLVFNEFK